MGVLPWSPLGGGVLTGKYARSDVATRATRASHRRAWVSLLRPAISMSGRSKLPMSSRGNRRGRRDAVPGRDRLDAREPRSRVACHGGAHTGPGERQSRRSRASHFRQARRSAQSGERAGSDLSRPLHGSSHGSAAHLWRRIRRPAGLKQVNSMRRREPCRLIAPRKKGSRTEEEKVLRDHGKSRTRMVQVRSNVHRFQPDHGCPCGQSSTRKINKQVVAEAFHRWAAGGTSFFDDVLAENVVWRIKGSGPSAGEFPGHKTFLERAVRPFATGCPLSSARLPYGSGPTAIM